MAMPDMALMTSEEKIMKGFRVRRDAVRGPLDERPDDARAVVEEHEAYRASCIRKKQRQKKRR